MSHETPGLPLPPVPPETLSHALAATRVRLHTAVWRRSLALSALVAAALVLSLLPDLPRAGLTGWMAALAAALLFRALVALRCQRTPESERNPVGWLRRLRVGFLVHGLVWGAGALLVPGLLGHDQLDLLVYAMAALMAGAIVGTTFDLVAALLFTTPALLSLVTGLVLAGNPQAQSSSVLLLLFLGVTYLSAQRAQALVRGAVLDRLAANERSTEAQRAQRELAEKHRLMSQLLRSTDEGFWFIDVDGVGTEVNPAMCRLLGRPAEQIIGRPVFDFFEGEDLATMRREIEARRAGAAHGRYEIGIRRPDGSRVYCLNQATVLTDAEGRRIGSVGIWTDLSGRRETEAALRTYERMTNAIPDLVSVIGEDHVYRAVNDAWCRFSDLRREEAIGRTIPEISPGGNIEPRLRALHACIEEQRPHTVCGMVPMLKGPPRLVETTYSPFHPDADGVRCAVVVSRDVSEREQARQALEVSAEYLRRTLGATGEAIFASEAENPDTPVRFHNEQMLSMWGITLAPGQPLTPRLIMAHALPLFEDGPAQQAIVADVIARNAAHESRVPLRDGRTLLRRCEPAQVGGRTLRVWSFRDITAEVQAMARLERLEADQRALLDAFPGLIGRLDENLVYTYANRSLAAALGRSPEQVIGRPASEVLGEARARQIAETARRTLAGETQVYEHRVGGRDGGPSQEMQVTLAPGLDPRTGRRAIYGFAIDISARKRAEAALIAARDDAQRANQAKSQFLSQMSHELRTPMNAVIGFGQLLQSDTAPPLAAHQQGWVSEMLRGAQHLLGLINEVLDLGRIEAGQLLLEMADVPLHEVVQEALALTQPLATRHGVQLLPCAGECDGLLVRADARRLKQVLLNLLANAIKYNRAAGRVEIHVAAHDGTVHLGVQDTGPGLAAEDIERLFQPFERLGAAKSGVEGTGIGLVVCKRLVEAMDGVMGVDSEPGVGSTFWLRLPQARPQPRVQPALQAPASDRAGEEPALARTVLHIEDNPVNIVLMEAMLARLPGLRVVNATLPEEGLRLARELQPALVLLDIQLPGMDGFAVLARLRAHAATREIPVVAVSANALPADVSAALAAGFLAYLTKPLNLDTLLGTVRRALQGAAQPG